MGVVYRATWRDRHVALKKLEEKSNKTVKAMGSVIAEEVLVQHGLVHVNVVTMFGFVKRQTEFWIVTELMDKSLDAFLYPVDEEGEEGECSLTQSEKKFISGEIAWFVFSLNQI